MNMNLKKNEVMSDVIQETAMFNGTIANEWINEKEKKSTYIYIKRVIDTILASIALILLSPIFLIIAIAIKLESEGPVFFLHKRIEKNGKTIKIYKFRSMVMNAEELKKYGPNTEKFLSVTSGLTGYWQVPLFSDKGLLKSVKGVA